jgi:DNA-binding MarR family transcriptional regulator
MKKSEITAKEISLLVPTFLRHMFPYVFSDLEIPPSQVIALAAIEEQGRCNLGQLKKEMHVSAPTVSGIIKRLERDGYVLRTVDEKDRRVVNVRLTPKGVGVVQKLRHNVQKRWEHILGKVPDEVGETVLTMIRRLTQGFKDGTI